jgi:hypothetical protein
VLALCSECSSAAFVRFQLFYNLRPFALGATAMTSTPGCTCNCFAAGVFMVLLQATPDITLITDAVAAKRWLGKQPFLLVKGTNENIHQAL